MHACRSAWPLIITFIWQGYTTQRSREALSTTGLHTRACVPSSVPSRFGGHVPACLCIQTYARMYHRMTSQNHVFMAGIHNTTLSRWHSRSMYASRDESCDSREEGGHVGCGHGSCTNGRTVSREWQSFIYLFRTYDIRPPRWEDLPDTRAIARCTPYTQARRAQYDEPSVNAHGLGFSDVDNRDRRCVSTVCCSMLLGMLED